MKKVLLILTGGTIASQKSESGLVPSLGAQDMLGMIPEINSLCEVDTIQVLNLDSSNMTPHSWALIADAIACKYNSYDSFVITHGTDTMAYMAAALACMLKNLDKPVILTGSQLPIEHPKTDAKENIYNAFLTSCQGVAGVYIVFCKKVIAGYAAKKMSTTNFDAFDSINYPVKAYIKDGSVVWQTRTADKNNGDFVCMSKLDARVLAIKLIPGMSHHIVDFAANHGYRGIIIEGFGMGGIPNANHEFLESVKKAVESGIIIVCLSQCIYGGVNLNVYAPGIAAKNAGVLCGKKMTFETVSARLMWALGNSQTPKQAAELFTEFDEN